MSPAAPLSAGRKNRSRIYYDYEHVGSWATVLSRTGREAASYSSKSFNSAVDMAHEADNTTCSCTQANQCSVTIQIAALEVTGILLSRSGLAVASILFSCKLDRGFVVLLYIDLHPIIIFAHRIYYFIIGRLSFELFCAPKIYQANKRTLICNESIKAWKYGSYAYQRPC
jgi:hypothetical protein